MDEQLLDAIELQQSRLNHVLGLDFKKINLPDPEFERFEQIKAEVEEENMKNYFTNELNEKFL